jgi:hypothetical protein
MKDKFDQLTKGLAQSTTRRQALKRFGVGLAISALACFGLADKAKADKGGCKGSGAKCKDGTECCSGYCQYGWGKYKGNHHGTCY